MEDSDELHIQFNLESGFWVGCTIVLILALPFTSCINLGKLYVSASVSSFVKSDNTHEALGRIK